MGGNRSITTNSMYHSDVETRLHAINPIAELGWLGAYLLPFLSSDVKLTSLNSLEYLADDIGPYHAISVLSLVRRDAYGPESLQNKYPAFQRAGREPWDADAA